GNPGKHFRNSNPARGERRENASGKGSNGARSGAPPKCRWRDFECREERNRKGNSTQYLVDENQRQDAAKEPTDNSHQHRFAENQQHDYPRRKPKYFNNRKSRPPAIDDDDDAHRKYERGQEYDEQRSVTQCTDQVPISFQKSGYTRSRG